MKIEISDDKSSATIDGVEYELKKAHYRFFKTEPEALEAHEKAMFNYEVEMFIKERNEGWLPEWTDFENKYYVIHSIEDGIWINNTKSYKFISNEKYFKSKEIGEEIIAKFDNEKLVKWWI